MPPPALPWSTATTRALYGPGGFFQRPEGPAAHFRTSVHASPLFAAALVRLLESVDDELGHPGRLDLVDVGAGRGELLLDVLAVVPEDLGRRLHLHAVELAPRPGSLPARVSWASEPPEDTVGLLVANEWLDDVPVDVVEAGDARSGDGAYAVLVDPSTGRESPGGPVGMRDAAWLARWWPLPDDAPAGTRAEVGSARDAAWAGAVSSLARGVALAVDYGHLRDERVAGRWAAGTLTGYRDGRAVDAVPDGSCDVTAHVAVDACAAAGERAGATATVLVRQRAALRALGLTGSLPPYGLAREDPRAYAAGLQRASQEAELLDRDGLGGFWWLAQAVATTMPDPLVRAGRTG